MTEQLMSRMLEKASNDESFTKGLVDAVSDKQGDLVIAAVAEYCSVNGFAVTTRDVADMQRQFGSSTDNSDGDLENVSGGFSFSGFNRGVAQTTSLSSHQMSHGHLGGAFVKQW
ncbi:hypothetical protein [Nisaea denitrificans]|uniref:hypothetical protein n=1 Tax=Nisaea denitrificans TaxID=390877 RepID=UPI0004061F85|nr:hypothetical protein [Nisaea denitrificans]